MSEKKNIDDICPLKWCVTHKRKHVYMLTEKSLNLIDWQRFELAEEKDFKFKTKCFDLDNIYKSLPLCRQLDPNRNQSRYPRWNAFFYGKLSISPETVIV